MDEYVGCIRQHVLERMDLSREMSDEEIENLIYVVRNKQVMVDSDLAMLYQVETGALNRGV